MISHLKFRLFMLALSLVFIVIAGYLPSSWNLGISVMAGYYLGAFVFYPFIRHWED